LDVPAGESRAGHSTSCDEALWLLTGSCTVEIDDGTTASKFRFHSGDQGLFLPAGVWLRLSEISSDTFVIVFASKSYGDTSYSDHPQLNLIAARNNRNDSAS
jgi:hypothetical protein